MMSYEHYQRIREAADPRRAFGDAETLQAVAALFAGELDRLAGEHYGDET